MNTREPTEGEIKSSRFHIESDGLAVLVLHQPRKRIVTSNSHARSHRSNVTLWSFGVFGSLTLELAALHLGHRFFPCFKPSGILDHLCSRIIRFHLREMFRLSIRSNEDFSLLIVVGVLSHHKIAKPDFSSIASANPCHSGKSWMEFLQEGLEIKACSHRAAICQPRDKYCQWLSLRVVDRGVPILVAVNTTEGWCERNSAASSNFLEHCLGFFIQCTHNADIERWTLTCHGSSTLFPNI